MATLLLSAVEICSAIFFHATKERFTFADTENYLAPKEIIPKLAKAWDRDLGWDSSYRTRFGERPRLKEYGEDLMATFGDSFTHCDQVKDGETWQHYLSEYVGKNVYNFGVGGYGSDQAYLKFSKDYTKVNTKLVSLGLIGENICRVVNVYRKFYWPRTAGPMTKPKFTLTSEGDLNLVDNPIRSRDEMVKLTDPKFLKQIGKDDYWFNLKGYPSFSFPYTRIFFNRYFWLEVIYAKNGKSIDDMVPRPMDRVTLWKSEYAKIMFAIFDRFVEESAAKGATPIITLIPTLDNAIHRFTQNENPENLQIIVDYCKAKNYILFNALDGLTARAESLEDIQSFYHGHVSAKGNRVIARSYYNFLTSNNLL